MPMIEEGLEKERECTECRDVTACLKLDCSNAACFSIFYMHAMHALPPSLSRASTSSYASRKHATNSPVINMQHSNEPALAVLSSWRVNGRLEGPKSSLYLNQSCTRSRQAGLARLLA
jgi:hypothetical protein